MRILYIATNHVPPSKDPRRNGFTALSATLDGDVLQPIWFARPEEVEREFGKGSYPVHELGGFRYHWFLRAGRSAWGRRLSYVWFCLSKGLTIYRSRKYDCVVTYSHLTPALCGLVLKLITGARVVVEVATSPDRLFMESHRPKLANRINRLYSDICLHISVWASDRIHLLAPWLLSSYKRLRNARTSSFHEFVAVSAIERRRGGEPPNVFFVGAPFFLKGVDVLIAAFKRLSPDFPEVKLNIMGAVDDPERWRALAKGCPQIEFLKAQPNLEVIEVMRHATVFVLPSRCEGMGRVILEAMAAGLPVVASDVGGIPSLVEDGETGFLVPVEDVGALESRLRQLLADPALRERMGARGYKRAHTEFTESVYVKRFTEMVELAVRGPRLPETGRSAGHA